MNYTFTLPNGSSATTCPAALGPFRSRLSYRRSCQVDLFLQGMALLVERRQSTLPLEGGCIAHDVLYRSLSCSFGQIPLKK